MTGVEQVLCKFGGPVSLWDMPGEARQRRVAGNDEQEGLREPTLATVVKVTAEIDGEAIVVVDQGDHMIAFGHSPVVPMRVIAVQDQLTEGGEVA